MDKKLIVVTYTIISHDNKIVLTSEKDRPGWKLPGGWVEWGESFEQAAAREAKEEINADNLIFKNLVGIWQHFGDDDHRIFVVLSAEVNDISNFKVNSEDIKAVVYKNVTDPELRNRNNFFKQRFFEAVLNYLDGKVYPIEMVRNFTRS